jgi:hypothetical protein
MKEVPNPNYNPQKELSPENFPTTLSEGSMAKKIENTLNSMIVSGKIQALYLQYIL